MSDSMMSSNNKSAWTDNAISNVPTDKNRTKTCDIKRNLPDWAKVVKTINGLPIYNINIFDISRISSISFPLLFSSG